MEVALIGLVFAKPRGKNVTLLILLDLSAIFSIIHHYIIQRHL